MSNFLRRRYISRIEDTSLPIGTTYEFNYTGTAQQVELDKGYWKLEVYGAQGGYRSSSTYGGKGGYATGILCVINKLNCYVLVGGSGNTGGTSGGFNGGGSRSTYAGGGGGTDIRISQNSLYARVIVAGGGGSDGATNKPGKAGGDTTGDSATENYGTGGGGGTQTAGGAGGNGNSGTFGQGGQGLTRSYGFGGAGGGGWYGGGGAYPDSSGDDDRGGGGGSGYVYTSTTAGNYPSGCLLNSSYYLTRTSMSKGVRTGDGYCKITKVEEPVVVQTVTEYLLAKGYQTCEYVTSNSIVDMDVKANSNTSATIIIKCAGYTGATTFGSTSYDDKHDWRFFNYSGGVIWDCGSARLGQDSSYILSNSTWYKVDIGNNYLSVYYEDGTTFNTWSGTTQSASQVSPSYNIYFCESYSDLYKSIVIKESGVEIRHYYPCYNTSNNAAYLYDKITDSFLTLSGTTHGSNITVSDPIE